jgi:hypothetical protein
MKDIFLLVYIGTLLELRIVVKVLSPGLQEPRSRTLSTVSSKISAKPAFAWAPYIAGSQYGAYNVTVAAESLMAQLDSQANSL